MCAASTHSTSTQSLTQETSVSQTSKFPVQNRNQRPNRNSQGGRGKFTNNNTAAQKPSDSSRNAKRARWAKKSRPVAKPRVEVGPVFEYISGCCSALARKPRAGQKEVVKDPDSGKMKDKPKGLGKWRCTACGKVAKVTPRKPEPKALPTGNMGGLHLDPYPGKLTTPVLSPNVAVLVTQQEVPVA